MPGETKPRQFRLTDSDLAMLDEVSARFGLRSRADAIRVGSRAALGMLPTPGAAPKKNPRKSKLPA